MNKKAFEFTFGWMFAIIVGGVILFLALYFSSNLLKTENKISDTKTAKEIGIILNPVENSLGEERTTLITYPVETRVYNKCRTLGNFGQQEISVASSARGGKWEEPGNPSIFYNKYIFSEDMIEGRENIVLSKSFEIPFKTADLLYIWPDSEKYCFIDPPSYIEKEIERLELRNINISSIEKCEKKSRKVCFSGVGTKCSIVVNLREKSVKKNEKKVFYEDDLNNALLYGAIFASPEIYECQVKRLMKRTSELSIVYADKSRALSVKGCSSNLDFELIAYSNATLSFANSKEIESINKMSEEIRRKNELLSCKLF
ncbi:MAG: hypothetical protein AABW65_02790 [Nanoarchaeota archaeon]